MVEMGNIKRNESVVKPRIFDTYLSVIKNSSGTLMFKNLYADVNGEKKDITDEGDLSCAFFVSSVLLMFKKIEGVHATVSSTVRDMEESGWIRTDEPKRGDVVVWGEKMGSDGKSHKHIGFFWNKGAAISNSKDKRHPVEHSLEMEGRETEAFFTKGSW